MTTDIAIESFKKGDRVSLIDSERSGTVGSIPYPDDDRYMYRIDASDSHGGSFFAYRHEITKGES